MEREVGVGIGMGNTCKPMALSFQCMTKSTTIKERKKEKKKELMALKRNLSAQMGLRVVPKQRTIRFLSLLWSFDIY